MSKKQLIKNLNLVKNCPICYNKNISKVGKINSKIYELNKIFNLNFCKKCEHRFLSKFPNQKYLNNLYKKNSHFVIGKYKAKELMKKQFIKKKFSSIIPNRNHWILKYINLKLKLNYLEIGPGLCHLYKVFIQNKWNCEGVELQNWITGPGIIHDFKKVKKNKKDIIVMLDVIEHMIYPNFFLKKLSKLQKRNGLLFLSFPYGQSLKSKILGSNWNMVHPLSHIHFFSKKSIKLLLKKNNYIPILIKSYSFVESYRLLRNIPKLMLKSFIDVFRLDFNKFISRYNEFFFNILDLINGDQLHVVAKKNSN